MCSKRQGDRYSNIGDLINDLKTINSFTPVQDSTKEDFDSNTRIIPIVKDESVMDVKKEKKVSKNLKKRNLEKESK